MEELLSSLEKQIKKLMEDNGRLSKSNQQLHQGKHSLVRERDVLAEKNKQAVSQIRSLVAMLKQLRDHDER